MSFKPPLAYAFAKANGVLVTALSERSAEVAVRNGASMGALSEVRRALGVPLQARQVGAEEFEELIATCYGAAEGGAAALADGLAQDLDLSRLLQEIPRIEDLLDTQHDAPLIRLINALLTQALRDGASDIHIEPFEKEIKLRYRVDGALIEATSPPKGLQLPIASRIKILAGLDIAERRLPQDGRISTRAAGAEMDVRVSFIPAVYGESIVMRLLLKEHKHFTLAKLGMPTGHSHP